MTFKLVTYEAVCPHADVDFIVFLLFDFSHQFVRKPILSNWCVARIQYTVCVNSVCSKKRGRVEVKSFFKV